MIERRLEVRNKLGLHARAAGSLVRMASGFRCRLTVEKDGTAVDARSIMGLMMLAASQGTEISLQAEGEDEREAVEALEELFARGFDEE